MREFLDAGRANVRASVALVIAGALLSCTDSTAPRFGEPARLEIVAGNAQRGTVGQELPNALVVKVVDDAGRGVPGQIVNFVVTAGGGRPFAGASITNQDGIAQERWTLGTSTRVAHRMEVRSVDTETGEGIVHATFTAIPVADVPRRAEPVNHNQVGIFGLELQKPIGVRFWDQYSNLVPGVSVDFEVTLGGGSVNPTTSISDSLGVAWTVWTLGPTAEWQTMEGRSASLVQEFGVSARKSEVASVQISPQEATLAIGESRFFSYSARAASGGITPATVLRWTSSDTTIARVTPDGLSPARVTGVRAGIATITVIVDGKPASAQVSVTGGDVAWVSVTPCCYLYPLVGETIQFTAQALDASFKPVPGRTATWRSTEPSQIEIDQTGLARVLAPTPVFMKIIATIDGVEQPVQIYAMAEPGPAAAIFKVSGDGQSGAASTQLEQPIVVRVTDELGHAVKDATVTWEPANGGSVDAQSSTTDAQGQASTRWTLGSAGPNSLTASAGGKRVTFSATATTTSGTVGY